MPEQTIKKYQCGTMVHDPKYKDKCQRCYYYMQPCLSEIRCPEGYKPKIREWYDVE